MLWRAGSGHRCLIHAFLFKDALSNLSIRWFTSPAHVTHAHPPLREPLANSEDPLVRFTGKISKSLLHKFPTRTAVFLSTIEELFATNAPKDKILANLQAVASESEVFSKTKQTCAFAQEVVKAACPEHAMHILHIAHRLGHVLPHNQYEQIAYQLAVRHHWRYVQVVTTMARKTTGSWTVRLLNWALRAYVETQDYASLDKALAEFDRQQLKPTRRTYHILVNGHLRNSDLARAQDCLAKMQASGFAINKSTYAIILSAYRSLGPNEAVETQAYQSLQGTGKRSDTMILNGLIKMRLDDHDIAGALRILRMVSLSSRNRDDNGGSGSAEENNGIHHVSSLSDSIIILPDSATFNILLMFLAHRRGELRNVIRVFRQMLAAGSHIDADTIAALIVAYATANKTGAALSLVYEMCVRHNILVNKNDFCFLGRIADGFDVDLNPALSVCPNTDVFNAILRAVLPEKGVSGLRRALRIMRDASIIPNASTTQIIITYLHDVHYVSPRNLVTVLHTLSAFPADEASLTVQHLNTVLRSLLRREIDILRTNSWNASAQRVRFGHISRFSSQRLSQVAHNFDPTAGISLGSYRGRISKLFEFLVEALIGRQVMSDRMTFALRIRRDAVVKLDIKSAQRAFDIMVSRGISPNAYHYSALIEGHAALGDMATARHVLESASQAGVKPNAIMYTILIKGFARTGQPDLAKQTFTDMVNAGVKPDFAALDAVVSAYWFVRAYKSARVLLLDLWPLVAPFPSHLEGAPLHVLVQYLRRYRGEPKTTAVRPIESHQERRRRTAVGRTIRRILADLEQWQEVVESVSWAKADIGLGQMLRTDTSGTEASGRERDWF